LIFLKPFLDKHFVDHIVEQTNKYFKFIKINFTLKNKFKLQCWKDTNCNEMYTLLAVCLLMSHVKKNKIKDYWSTSFLLSTPAFGQLMSQNRFLLILRLLHFNDNFKQILGDRIYKIKPIIETLRKKFKNSFSPDQKMCIDESIVEWKGRLCFKQFIPSKRHRFGIKLFVLCDCESGYILDFLVYTGAQTQIDLIESLGMSGSVVSTLMKPYFHKGHIIYLDNWYTSPTLFKYLSRKKTGGCGTVKINRKGMPKLYQKLKPGECVYGISKKSKLLALKWKDKRDVFMLSSIHNHKMKIINTPRKTTSKPNSILDYNNNRGLVDKSDDEL